MRYLIVWIIWIASRDERREGQLDSDQMGEVSADRVVEVRWQGRPSGEGPDKLRESDKKGTLECCG